MLSELNRLKLKRQGLDPDKKPRGLKDLAEQFRLKAGSNYPIRLIGNGKDGPMYWTEEDRESHVHIIGSPGEGKSKLLELLLRHDIDNGVIPGNYGACLLDPSDNGDTLYKVLKYALVRGVDPKKIILIEPNDIYAYGKVPAINPVHVKRHNEGVTKGKPDMRFAPGVIANIVDAVQILWRSDFAAFTNVKKFLRAVMMSLYAAEMTLAELDVFLDFWGPMERRSQVLQHMPQSSQLDNLLSAFKTESAFKDFKPTAARLMPFDDGIIKLMLGSSKGIDFREAITKGYLVLVNLDPAGVYGEDEQRLLGTIVINEIVAGVHQLRKNHWQGRFYLYIDEVGDYATTKIATLVDKKRKSGLILTVAHQGFDQIKLPDVLSSLYRSTKIKVMFHTANPEDRAKMLRIMSTYYSDSELRGFQNIRKRNALIKQVKLPAREVTIETVDDVSVPRSEVDEFKRLIYNSSPLWYAPVARVQKDIDARFASRAKSEGGRIGQPGTHVQDGADTRTSDDGDPVSQADAPRQERRITSSFFKKKNS